MQGAACPVAPEGKCLQSMGPAGRGCAGLARAGLEVEMHPGWWTHGWDLATPMEMLAVLAMVRMMVMTMMTLLLLL